MNRHSMLQGLCHIMMYKEVVQTFVIITDEEENTNGKTADDIQTSFFQL